MATLLHHIAQINVARLRAPLDDPAMADFMAELARVNALADADTDMIWRLQTAGGDATSLRPYSDPMVIVNITVWRTLEALHRFTYRGDHAQAMKSRVRWFDRLRDASVAIWWIRAGELPTVEDAVRRLDHLREHGPTEHAFDFRTKWPPPRSS